MKMESEAWRLDGILVNLRIPIGDPNFLDNLSHRMGAVGSMTEESQALRHLHAIASAQESYAAAFPNRGFACSLADLGGTGDGTPGRPSARMIDRTFDGGTADGYSFSITDCSGSPVNHFRSVAVPVASEGGLRTFCSDESGAIHYSEDGEAAACLSPGQPLP